VRMSEEESDGSYNEQSDEDDDSSFEERVAKAKAKPSSARKSSPSKNRSPKLPKATASNQRSSPTNRKIASTSKRSGEAQSRRRSRQGFATATASIEVVGDDNSDSEGPPTGQKVPTPTKSLLGKRNSKTRKESMLDANDSDFGDDNEKAESTGATANEFASPSTSKVSTTKPTKRLLSKKAVAPKDSYDIVLPPHIVNNNQHGECTILMQIDHHCRTIDLTGAVGAIGRLEVDHDRGTFLARFQCSDAVACLRVSRFFILIGWLEKSPVGSKGNSVYGQVAARSHRAHCIRSQRYSSSNRRHGGTISKGGGNYRRVLQFDPHGRCHVSNERDCTKGHGRRLFSLRRRRCQPPFVQRR
jgi:hypothetical protein